MDITLFLAQAIGIYFLVMGVALVVRNKELPRLINSFFDNEAMSFLVGFFALVVGLLIVLSHNIWESGVAWLVTLVGWVALVKGVMYLIVPKTVEKIAKKMMVKSSALIWYGIALILVGAWLAGRGFGLF